MSEVVCPPLPDRPPLALGDLAYHEVYGCLLGCFILQLFQDSKGGWRVSAVPEEEGSFVSRKKLPEAWRGLRDDALSAESGIEGGGFVHTAGFIGGNKTREGVLAMAAAAVEL